MNTFSQRLERPHQEIKEYLASARYITGGNPWEYYYLEGFYYYITGETASLQLLLKQKPDNKTQDNEFSKRVDLIYDLLKMRLALRLRDQEATQNQSNRILAHCEIEEELPAVFRGEAFLLLARACELSLSHERAHFFYEKSAHWYREDGMLRRELIAKFNAQLCLERLNRPLPFSSYRKLYQSALDREDYDIAGATLNCLGFKIMFLGAYQTSLTLYKEALRLLAHDRKSLNYALVQANLAHLYLHLNYETDLKLVKKELQIYTYPEIQNVLPLLSLNKEENQTDLILTPGWYQRWQSQLKLLEPLSDLEDRLIGHLALKNKTLEKLIASLWAEELEQDILHSRFKRVLARLR